MDSAQMTQLVSRAPMQLRALRGRAFGPVSAHTRNPERISRNRQAIKTEVEARHAD